MKLKALLPILFIQPLVCFSQYTFKKYENEVIVEKIQPTGSNHIALDTFYAKDCTTIGTDVYILTRVNRLVSSPYYIYITHYSYASGHKVKVAEYEIPPSIESIQVRLDLEGSYLQIMSLKGLKYKGVKPHGTIMPFSEQEMTGEKKVQNLRLNHKNLSQINKIITYFNDW